MSELVAVCVALLGVLAPAASPGPAGEGGGAGAEGSWLLPPGQDRLLRRVLGGDEALAGACRLDELRVVSSRVEASYRCEEAEGVARLTLLHPEDAPAGTPSSERLAVLPGEGASEALVQAVLDRARGAGQIRWVPLQGKPEPEPARLAPAPEPLVLTERGGSGPSPWALLVALVAGVGLAVDAARGLRARRRG